MSLTSDYLKRKKELEEEEKAGNKTTRKSSAPKPLFVNKTAALYVDNDIAPVRTTTKKETQKSNKKDEERTWFSKGAFEDGWQFGDLAKTIIGTTTDITENVGAGILGMGEKVIDAGAYAVGGVGGLFGNDKLKDNMSEFIKKDLYNEEEIAKKIVLGNDDNSIFGEKSDSLMQSGGQLLGTIALQGVGVPWFITSGVTSFGAEAEGALNEGASYGEAGVSAAISAGAEILTEKLFGGSGLGEKGLINLEPLTKGISSKIVKALADHGVDMAAESAEEVVSQFASNFASSLYKEENLKDILFSEEAVDGYIEAAIGGGVLGGVMNASNMVNSVRTGRDYRSGLNENEQKVVDKEYEKRLAEEDRELTKKEKDKIYNEVLNDLDEGGISIDTIEEVLGGERYQNYKAVSEHQDAIKEEHDTLNRMKQGDMTGEQLDRLAELKAQLKTFEETNERDNLKNQLGEEVFGLAKDSRLVESYNERGRRSQAFTADLTQYDTKQQEVIKKAVDSGILNNTKRTHKFVDMVSKISADKGVLFDFANNDKLKESGFAIDGKTVNGFVTKDGVTLNIDSAKSLNTVVGHEITHVLEGTELYGELQSIMKTYAETKGEYESRRTELAELYKDIEDADIDAELTADLVGDYLFTDENFINNLSTNHRNVFQKIYDEVKYLCKVATAGSKEARQLEKVKRAFEKAYKEGGNKSEVKTEDVSASDTKYSVSVTDKDTINFLENQEHITTYKAMQVIDGKLYPPMAAKVKDENGRYQLTNPSQLGKWQQATEDPTNIKKMKNGVGYYTLNKGDGTSIDAAYNPYEHSSNLVLNDQFESAHRRDNLVVVECVIPVSEMSSGYKAQYAKDGTGVMDWKSGVVAGKIKDNKRQVYLSRYLKPVRILSDAEVATKYKEILDGTGVSVPFNVVQPSLLAELEKAGVAIDYEGSPMYKANQKRAAEKAKYSVSDSDGKQLSKEQQDYFKDSKVRDENGNLKVMYHGSRVAGFHEFIQRFSDDNTSFFFVDSNEVAQSYSGTHETYTAKTIRTAEDFYSLFEEIEADDVYEVKEENGKFVLYDMGDAVAESDTAQGLYDEWTDYAGVGHGLGNYKVYLNLKNPLEVDAQGRDWNNLTGWSKYANLKAEDVTVKRVGDEFQLFKGEQQVENASITVNQYNQNMDTEVLKSIMVDKVNSILAINTENKRTTRDIAKFAKEHGYDGVIFKNIVDIGNYGSTVQEATVAIAFDSNQIKSVANEKPTADADIRYSLSKDSEGRELSESQSEYFKDSKVKDENGNLKVVYHGSGAEFTEFSYDYMSTHGSMEGQGFYFTDSEDMAKGYQENGAKLMKGYLSIKKPLSDSKVTIKRNELSKLLKAVDPTGDDVLINYDPSGGMGYPSKAWYNRALAGTVDNMLQYNSSDSEIFADIANSGAGTEAVVRKAKEVLGYDGYIVEGKYDGANVYVAFESNQFKNMDNLNPTSDPDIRRSLSNGEAPVYGNYNVYGKDIALKTTKQTTKELDATNKELDATTKETSKVVAESELFHDDMAPMPEDTERLDSLTDEDAPPVREAPYQSDKVEAADPFYDRDIGEVGNRKVKAYMYENPEVKPFFQQEAQGMLYDLRNSIKGEKWYNDEVYYETGGERGWGGTTRHTTDDIAELLDKHHYTYAEIEKGLNAIIEDHGAENNAVSKRIEFMLNDRLMYGYKDVDGRPIEANQDYINLIAEKQINEYSKEAFDAFMENADAYAPEEDIAPVADEAEQMVETNIGKMPLPEYRDMVAQQRGFNDYADMRSQGVTLGNGYDDGDIAPVKQAPVKEKYEAIRPKPTKEPRMAKATPEEQARAEIMVEEPKVEQKKSGVLSKVKNLVLDKGMVFEDLSLKTGNRELQARWNSIRYADSKAQHLMEKGNSSTSSLKSIRETVEKSGKVKQFYEYLYHLHNVDRMNLEDRYEDVENKPVFGYDVTSEMSRETAVKLEQANPEFKQYAKEVYGYLTHLRELMVESGVISRETAKLWAEMYPHYVPIRRKGDTGLNVNVPLDTGRTGVNAPVKRATGGNRDILPLFDTMGQRTLQTYKAIAKNRFGVELKNTLGTTIDSEAFGLDEAIDSVDTHEGLLQEGKNGRSPTFTVFENGEKVTFEITEEMYDSMKPTSDTLAYTNKTLNRLNNLRRGLITEYNPAFALTNPIKDAQDVLINSQHPVKTYKNFPKAVAELWGKKGHWYQEYMENGGEQNTYFDKATNTFAEEKSGLAKLAGIPLDKMSGINNFVERVPRLAEYIASREAGRSIDVAMLDAARVTTNFAAGGDLTKFANRNGFTFLNASVQGFMQNVRNVREAKENGVKGWATLAAKFAVAGLPSILLNHLMWGDDEEYEELSDYVKQNYYVVAKFGDGQFVRIPKGRTLAVIQNGFEQMEHLITGDDEADLRTFGELLISNLAPNNPLENNVIAPIAQAWNNRTWYGEDLVPTRLQDKPTAEQYDESTDAISKWLGEHTPISPYKWNYVLDQYSGGVGDMLLPYLTQEAERGSNSLFAPIMDKFTTDSVMNNQNVSDFYNKKDELTVKANADKATEEDVLMSKYMNSVNAELGKLYGEKREIQNSDLPDDEKYEAVREIQKQIDALAEESLTTYQDVSYEDDYREGGEYARVHDRLYKKDKDGEWQKLSAEQATKYEVTKSAGDADYATDGTNHYRWYVPGEDASEDAKPHWEKISDDDLEKQKEVTKALRISPETYWSNKAEYDYAYKYPGKYEIAKAVGGYKDYDAYKSAINDIDGDKDANGDTIRGTEKANRKAYIFGLNIPNGEKYILYRSYYSSKEDKQNYNMAIINYLNSRDDISYDEMKAILEELDMKVDSNGNISWD